MSAVGIVEEHRERVLAEALRLLAAVKPIIQEEADAVLFSNALWEGEEPIRESLDLDSMEQLKTYEQLVADIERVLGSAWVLS